MRISHPQMVDRGRGGPAIKSNQFSISDHNENLEHLLCKFSELISNLSVISVFSKVFLWFSWVSFMSASAQFNLETISTPSPERTNSKIYVIKTTPRPDQFNNILERPKAIKIARIFSAKIE